MDFEGSEQESNVAGTAQAERPTVERLPKPLIWRLAPYLKHCTANP
ncbi:MAG: hypothetical protein ACYSTI_13895 [Planctomycetota bacterium]